MEWEKYSKYDKCLRVSTDLKAQVRDLAFNTNPTIKVEELRVAEQKLVKLVQGEELFYGYALLKKNADRSSHPDIMAQ